MDSRKIASCSGEMAKHLSCGCLAGLIGGIAFAGIGSIQHAPGLINLLPSGSAIVFSMLYSISIYGLLGCLLGIVLSSVLGIGLFVSRIGPSQRTLYSLYQAIFSGGLFVSYVGQWWMTSIPTFVSRSDPVRVRAGLILLFLGLLVSIIVYFFLHFVLKPEWRGRRKYPLRLFLPVVIVLFILLSIASSKKLNGIFSDQQKMAPKEIASERVSRILLIGLCGADWKVMMPLLREGKLPTIAKLMESGAWGTCLSYGRVHHSDATSIVTGKRPSQHGIISSVVHEKGRIEPIPSQVYHRKTLAVWNVLSQRERRVAVINWLVTSPPESINGIMVSPKNYPEGYWTYPPHIVPELEEMKRIALEKLPPTPTKMLPAQLGRLSNLLKTEFDFVRSLSLQLFSREKWDLFIANTFVVDHTQHLFWKYMEPERFHKPVWSVKQEDVEKYSRNIEAVYERVDSMIGDFVGWSDENTTIIVVSDHGMKPLKSLFVNLKLNLLLEKMGLLVFKEASDSSNVKDFNLFLEKVGRPPFKIGVKSEEIVHTLPDQLLFGWMIPSRTKAYSSGVRHYETIKGININVKGREDNGLVAPGEEYERLRKNLVTRLKGLKVLESGTPLFNGVYLRENDPNQRSANSYFDVTIHVGSPTRTYGPNRHVLIDGQTYRLDDFLEDEGISAIHRPEGIFIIAGRNIRKKILLPKAVDTPLTFVIKKYRVHSHLLDRMTQVLQTVGIIEPVSTLDITPTILYLMGLPVAKDMDGSVLKQVMDPSHLDHRSISWIESYDIDR